MLNLNVTIQCKHWVSLESRTFAIVSMVSRQDYHVTYSPYFSVGDLPSTEAEDSPSHLSTQFC